MSKEITGKAKRIAAILALAETGSVSMQALADNFGVSARTIQRDFGLIVQASIPFISHQQGRLYSFAKGFCLKAVNISAQETAVLVVSYDIAQQLGGDFDKVRQDIVARFAPPSFDGCDFYPDISCIPEPLRNNIELAIKETLSIKLQIKTGNTKVNLKLCKLLCLENKLYLACLEKDGNISFIDFDNISQDYSEIRGKFKCPPFLEWYIWRCAKNRLNKLPPEFAACGLNNTEEKPETAQDKVENKNASLSVKYDIMPSQKSNIYNTADEPEYEAKPNDILKAEQNKSLIPVESAVAEETGKHGQKTEEKQDITEQKLSQEGTINAVAREVLPVQKSSEIPQDVLPETPPSLDIPELSSYSPVLNEELSRFLNADIESPSSGLINIGKDIMENFVQDTCQDDYKENK